MISANERDQFKNIYYTKKLWKKIIIIVKILKTVLSTVYCKYVLISKVLIWELNCYCPQIFFNN